LINKKIYKLDEKWNLRFNVNLRRQFHAESMMIQCTLNLWRFNVHWISGDSKWISEDSDSMYN